MATYQNATFHGIIMYANDYRERDQLIKIFTGEFGKKMFFVKDGKRRGFRLRSALLPFTTGEYVGNLNDQGLSFINAAKQTHQLQTISADINKNAYATYILSLVDAAFRDGQMVPDWYMKVQQALTLIDNGLDEQIITNIIEIQLLTAFGVAPQLQQCAICGRTDLPFDYSEKFGGLICQNHFDQDSHRLHLDARTIFYLRQFSVIDLMKITTISVSPKTKRGLRRLIDLIYDNSVGLHLRAKRFIDQMSSWEDQLAQQGEQLRKRKAQSAADDAKKDLPADD
ncbi:DNA repair protein RecO [Furfurilactobacillus siliginis]|uniref:DNA repair protein RecO n=1 Tax=Furfurilactobacillus siliginis TaxID=348151 RepID=A0A0R2L6D5_9LACO|nr:DNA repair protein RecO [Furfurilactobacillus siliginis]KRN97041.1 recombinational DNA repair protein (RecF pathway) [Furfurilactobacillus siliginis]GEK27802.1 DNA repair protein RecO [Furfurilactobacillus siliginis]